MKAYRHGEIAFFESNLEFGELSKLEESKTSVFAKGSEGNSHSFKGGKYYKLDKMQGHTIGYFKAKSTKLYHPQHSPKGAKLPDGDYEVRTAIEHTPEGLVPVRD